MIVATLCKQLGLEPPKQPLPDDRDNEILAQIAIDSAGLVKSIQENTVTAEQIDSFIRENLDRLTPSNKKPALGLLLSKKAFLLFRDGHEEEGLESYDEALKVYEAPSTWALKGSALLQMSRLDEAFQSFEKAFSLRDDFGPRKQEHLKILIEGWSTAALIRGLYGILEQNVTEAQKGVEEYIALLDRAREEELEASVLNLAVEQPVSDEIKDALEEMALMVRLLSIKDPFEGWRELGREISKVWPKGVSAVDAVREQRDRNWKP